MKKLKFQAFTLVELLIVVAILAVLATVGFVSYSNYLTGVRDTNRVTQLVGIRNAIETFKTTKDTPLPEEKIDIEVNGELIAYQGIVGQNILNQIGLSDGGTDPKDETYFPYYLTRDKKYFQLMTFLEDEPDTEEELTFFPQTYASTDYSIRYPKVIGFPLGILTEKDTNTPLHEIETLSSSGYLDVATTSDEYTAYFMDEDTITGSGDILPSIAPSASCKRILDMGRSKGDGIYTINPTGTESFQVYCDMTTDGGGWILLAKIIDGGTNNWGYSNSNWTSNTVFNEGGLDFSLVDMKSKAFNLALISKIKLIDENSNELGYGEFTDFYTLLNIIQNSRQPTTSINNFTQYNHGTENSLSNNLYINKISEYTPRTCPRCSKIMIGNASFVGRQCDNSSSIRGIGGYISRETGCSISNNTEKESSNSNVFLFGK